jgi:hypothetical protein
MMVLACLLIFALSAAALQADDVALGGFGSTLLPMEVESVSMVSEEIQVEVFRGKSFFSCHFVFLNESDVDREFLIGFPASHFDWRVYAAKVDSLVPDHLGAKAWDDLKVYDFEIFVNGESVESRFHPGRVLAKTLEETGGQEVASFLIERLLRRGMAYGRYEELNWHLDRPWGHWPPFPREDLSPWDLVGWYVWPVRMEAGEKLETRHTYWVPHSVNGASDEWLRYIITTGGYWKDGVIGKVDIVVHFNNVVPFFNFTVEPPIQPEGYVFGNETVEWHLKDLTPTEDLFIHWHNWRGMYVGHLEQDYDDYHVAKALEEEGQIKKALALYRKIASRGTDSVLLAWAQQKLSSKYSGSKRPAEILSEGPASWNSPLEELCDRDLILASILGRTEIVEGLLREGVDVNARDSEGYTALMRAAQKGHIEIVERLLRRQEGTDVDVQDFEGFTALMRAIERGYLDIVPKLLQAGADACIENKAGLTALDLARIRGYQKKTVFPAPRTAE